MPRKNWYKRRDFPIFEIEWDDAASDSKWAEIRYHQEGGVANCRTVGYLTAYEKTHIQVAQSLSSLGHAADSMCIPRGCVTRIRKVR